MYYITTVCKTGEEYKTEHVLRLFDQVDEFININHQKIVFTDDLTSSLHTKKGEKISRLPLISNLPRQWNQLEMFRHSEYYKTACHSHIFYMDLDTVIVDRLDNMLLELANNISEPFLMLRDVARPRIRNVPGSGIMYANPYGAKVIWNLWEKHKDEIKTVPNPSKPATYGNVTSISRGFFKKYVKPETYLQDYFPRAFCSYKKHCKKFKHYWMPPKTAKIICFHGRPLPWEIKLYKFDKEEERQDG